jgi:hypothetical protein
MPARAGAVARRDDLDVGAPENIVAQADIALTPLQQAIVANRFMPTPPRGLCGTTPLASAK